MKNLTVEELLTLVGVPDAAGLVRGIYEFPLAPSQGCCPLCAKDGEVLKGSNLRVAFCPDCKAHWPADHDDAFAYPFLEGYGLKRGLRPPEPIN